MHSCHQPVAQLPSLVVAFPKIRTTFLINPVLFCFNRRQSLHHLLVEQTESFIASAVGFDPKSPTSAGCNEIELLFYILFIHNVYAKASKPTR